MSRAQSSTIRPPAVSTPKARLFAADGAFVARVTPEKADALLNGGIAEWRGRDLRIVHKSIVSVPREESSFYGRHFLQTVAGHQVSALRGVEGSK